MTQRKPTQKEIIDNLKVHIANRKARLDALLKMREAKALKKSELKKIDDEISEHICFIRKAERDIAKFYAPAA